MIRFINAVLFILFLFFSFYLNAQQGNESYSASSVLSSGQWFKIALKEDGIYRIDYSKLIEMGLSFPSNPKIFSNNSGQLSYFNSSPHPDDLREIPLSLVKGSDGIFNTGDYLLFYGQGTNRWVYDSNSGEYIFKRHNYSDTAFYFITSSASPGKTVNDADNSGYSPGNYSTSHDALYIHEVESENLIRSGREWYQGVSPLNATIINPSFTDIVTTEKIKYSIRVLARSSIQSQFRFNEGNSMLEEMAVAAVNLYAYTGAYAAATEVSRSSFPLSSSPSYTIQFLNKGEQSADGWLDYLKLQARRTTVFSGKTLQFSDSRSVAPDAVTEFTVKSVIESPVIWEVSDPFSTKRILYTRSGDNIRFRDSSSQLRTYIVFTPDKAMTPIIKYSQVPAQDLHASEPADMIIITHPLFLDHAGKLAGIHYRNSGLLSLIVTPGQIYNEYSGGVPDIVAIRNFVRMKYIKQKNSSHPLKYLLLFGDGSYENKTPPPRNPNFIPTWQSQNSINVVSSFTSDDFYGLLDDGEGEADGTEDIGIGRLPVSDTLQAGIVISKIERYLDPANMGDWKNIICMTADDEDGNTHMYDAEGLASVIESKNPSVNIEKIYLDAFRQVTSAAGQSYPDVTRAINNRINDGCLIFNYTGHGNENGLTHERVLKNEDVNSWKNSTRLPLFITATCEFSRFDDVEININNREITPKTSGGELVLLSRNGGGIALMATTRVVYSAPNYTLNRNIYNYAFTRDADGNALRLGDIIRLAKNNSGTGYNKRNFLLLGDPALRLAYPCQGNVVTDSINSVAVTGNTDTLKALSKITVSGRVEDNNGAVMEDFYGIVSHKVFDKTGKIKTLANDGGLVMEFDLQNNILFSGKTRAERGRFRFTFIVPNDIDYKFGNGKISYYAGNDSLDMAGSFNDIIVGGFSNENITDKTGPDIELYMNDTLFMEGGITDNNPELLAIVEDSGGINTTGSGIGHDIIAFIDNDRNNYFVLNNYFENDFNNYSRGSVLYKIGPLDEGSHTLTFKAWDNFNNSSEKTIHFMVEDGGRFVIKNLLNFPNPVINSTSISAEHNRPGEELDVIIRIFSLNGTMIKEIETTVTSSGYKLPPVEWDGNSDGGKRAGRGIYPYTVTITTDKGERAIASGRILIL
jgi:hypothetical protein